jgi:hypothetical protein
MGETTGQINAMRHEVVRPPEEPSADVTPETAHIRSQIVRTRADMTETISALEEKLDPSYLADQVKEQLREKASDAYESAKDSLREVAGRTEKVMSDVGDTVSDAAQRAGTVVKQKSSSLMNYARSNPAPFTIASVGLGILAFKLRRDHPVGTGMAALAAAGIAGLCMPPMRSDGTSMSMSNYIFDRARSVVHEASHKIQHIAEEATHAYQESASRNRGASMSLEPMRDFAGLPRMPE